MKAHSSHPGTSELAGQAIVDAAEATGMPKGVFSLLFGSGREVGVALVQHPLIKAVGFTGSFTGGTTLFDLAVSRKEPIPVYAEMSSVNPVFMLPQALSTRAQSLAESLHQSATVGTGQFCTNPGLVFYDGNAEFRNHLIKLYAESPPACMLTEKMAQVYSASVKELRGSPTTEDLVAKSSDSPFAFVATALLEVEAEDLMQDATLADEVFGPLTMLVTYKNREQLFAVARSLAGQLTASIHAAKQDLEDFTELPAILESRAGRLLFNQFPTGVEVSYAMVHGGPFPATTDARSTSVGAMAIFRFVRPVCYQNFPAEMLPPALRDSNPLRLRRLVDGVSKSC